MKLWWPPFPYIHAKFHETQFVGSRVEWEIHTHACSLFFSLKKEWSFSKSTLEKAR